LDFLHNKGGFGKRSPTLISGIWIAKDAFIVIAKSRRSGKEIGAAHTTEAGKKEKSNENRISGRSFIVQDFFSELQD